MFALSSKIAPFRFIWQRKLVRLLLRSTKWNIEWYRCSFFVSKHCIWKQCWWDKFENFVLVLFPATRKYWSVKNPQWDKETHVSLSDMNFVKMYIFCRTTYDVTTRLWRWSDGRIDREDTSESGFYTYSVPNLNVICCTLIAIFFMFPKYILVEKRWNK